MVALNFLFLGLALWIQAIAAWPGLDVYYVTCATRLGGMSTRPIPTSTKTIATTFTWTRRVFTKVTSTITPIPDTTTVITTETKATTITNNANTVTGTATTTFTVTNTATNIVTATSTSMASMTTTLSTLPPPAGFTAIADSPGFVPKIKRRNNLVSERAPANSRVQCKLGPKGKGVVFTPAQYPQAVDCLRVGLKLTTTTKTFQIGGKTTTLPRATSTVTSAVTTTQSTFINPPDVTAIVTVSTTVTITSTSQSTTTTTVTSTTTFTDTVPTPYYAACGSSNIISSANGGKQILAVGMDGTYTEFQGVASAYDCCVSCQKTANCLGSIFSGSSCFGTVASACWAGQVKGNFYTDPETANGFIISNGPCGIFSNSGDVQHS